MLLTTAYCDFFFNQLNYFFSRITHTNVGIHWYFNGVFFSLFKIQVNCTRK